jgi:hypothetical protein
MTQMLHSSPARFAMPVRRLAALGLGLLLAGGALAEAPPTTPLGQLSAIQCPNFQSLEASYTRQFASRMQDFSQAEMADLQGRPVLYLFSGPDIVTAMALFPKATHLTLVADQKPEYEQLVEPQDDDPGRGARECRMLSFFSHLGYYRTDDLNGKVGTRPRFIKLLAYSIGFGGGRITGAELLAIGTGGELQAFAPGGTRKPHGVRFHVQRRDGTPLDVDYLTIDLANHGLKADPDASAYLKRAAADVLFLKSASHLLQSPHFSVLADLLTNPPAPFVVQDETGLGIDRLHKAYTLTLYGKFTNPQALWAHNPAARAFADEYAAHPVKGPVPFTIGYEKRAGSALIVGRRATP